MKGVGVQYIRKGGFTIVELLIVVIVIVILALIVVGSYVGVTNRGHDAAIHSDMDGLSDQIELKALDDNVYPAGGSTDAGVGTPTNFTGMSYRATRASYDTEVTNLYYCNGAIGGIDVYAIAARSKSGKQYVYKSNAGISELTGITFTSGPMAGTVCPAAGFSAPYTYSYGYNPGTGWATWVTP